MTLHKGRHRNVKYIIIPWTSGVGEREWVTAEVTNSRNCFSSVVGGKYVTACICENSTELYTTKDEL